MHAFHIPLASEILTHLPLGNILTREVKGVDPIALITWTNLVPIVPLGLFSIVFERNKDGAALFQLSSAGVGQCSS